MMSSPTSFLCKLCKKDERMDPSWLHHISSLGHQRALTRLPSGGHGEWGKTSLTRERAIEVVGCQELKAATTMDIADYLTKNGGTLEEFICPTSITGTKPEIVFCLFKDAQSVGRLLGIDEPKIFRQQIKIRRKFSCWDDDDDNKPLSENKTMDCTDGVGNGHNNGTTSTQTRRRKRHRKRRLPKLDDQLADLFKLHNPTPRIMTMKELQKIFKSTFSNCTVFPYGTDHLGICFDTDDSRFCVDPYGALGGKTTGVISSNQSDSMSSNLLFQILSTHKLPDGSPRFKFVSQYSASSTFNVPEISFKYQFGNDLVPCKVRFENFLSAQKSRLLKFLTNHDLRVWSLFSLIRHWSRKNEVLCELKDGEEFEGYIVILMMTFYLIKSNVVPSISKLRYLSKNNPLVVGNIDMCFCSDRKILPSAKVAFMDDISIRNISVLGLLKGFFDFFSAFNFSEDVICTSTGMVLDRKCFRTQMESKLPSELMKNYRYNADGSLREQKLNIFTPAVVQDVFDLTDNVARGIDEIDLAFFQSKCAETSKFLAEVTMQGSGDLSLWFGKKTEDDDDMDDYESEEEELKHEEWSIPTQNGPDSNTDTSNLPNSSDLSPETKRRATTNSVEREPVSRILRDREAPTPPPPEEPSPNFIDFNDDAPGAWQDAKKRAIVDPVEREPVSRILRDPKPELPEPSSTSSP